VFNGRINKIKGLRPIWVVTLLRFFYPFSNFMKKISIFTIY